MIKSAIPKAMNKYKMLRFFVSLFCGFYPKAQSKNENISFQILLGPYFTFDANQKMTDISYRILWRSEVLGSVSAKGKLQDIYPTQTKPKLKKKFEGDEDITKEFEASIDREILKNISWIQKEKCSPKTYWKEKLIDRS